MRASVHSPGRRAVFGRRDARTRDRDPILGEDSADAARQQPADLSEGECPAVVSSRAGIDCFSIGVLLRVLALRLNSGFDFCAIHIWAVESFRNSFWSRSLLKFCEPDFGYLKLEPNAQMLPKSAVAATEVIEFFPSYKLDFFLVCALFQFKKLDRFAC